VLTLLKRNCSLSDTERILKTRVCLRLAGVGITPTWSDVLLGRPHPAGLSRGSPRHDLAGSAMAPPRAPAPVRGSFQEGTLTDLTTGVTAFLGARPRYSRFWGVRTVMLRGALHERVGRAAVEAGPAGEPGTTGSEGPASAAGPAGPRGPTGEDWTTRRSRSARSGGAGGAGDGSRRRWCDHRARAAW
jgi:hypothetical protein